MAKKPYKPDLEAFAQRLKELSRPRPIYTPAKTFPGHSLNYDWSGWPTAGDTFPTTVATAISECKSIWADDDNLQLTESKLHPSSLQLCFTANPHISPVKFASRVKGRLQHALRAQNTPVNFSRKVSVRTLGENIRKTVEGYLQKQVKKEKFADPRFEKRMNEYTIETKDLDLAEPTSTNSGRYWYNLHVVLVISGRARIIDYGMLSELRDSAITVAAGKGFRLKSLAVMPDHTHIALGGDVAQSPEEIALTFMNNIAYLMGQNRIFDERYYVGSFSEYDMNTIRS